MLIIIKATAINATTRPPATKLEIKFANEVVIFNTVYLQIKIKNSKINYNINYIPFLKKNQLILDLLAFLIVFEKLVFNQEQKDKKLVYLCTYRNMNKTRYN